MKPSNSPLFSWDAKQKGVIELNYYYVFSFEGFVVGNKKKDQCFRYDFRPGRRERNVNEPISMSGNVLILIVVNLIRKFFVLFFINKHKILKKRFFLSYKTFNKFTYSAVLYRGPFFGVLLGLKCKLR